MDLNRQPSQDRDIISVVSQGVRPAESHSKSSLRGRSYDGDVIDAIKRRIARNVRTSDSKASVQLPKHDLKVHGNKQESSKTEFNDSRFGISTLLPGSRTKKQIYYEALVQSVHWTDQQYRDRYDYVARELADKITESFGEVSFELWMVGTSPQTAVPSIVIYCQAEDVKPLKALFSPARHKLYCARNSKAYKLFKIDPPKEPPFKLEYFRTAKAIDRKAAWETVETDLNSTGDLCGASIRYGNTRANIGITLCVQDRILSTTVDHLFGVRPPQHVSRDSDDDTISVCSNGSEQATLIEDDLISLDPLWVDNPEDDDLEELGPLQPVGHPLDVDLTMTCLELSGTTSILRGHKVDGLIDLPASSCFRDFALLQLDVDALKKLKPNTFLLPGSEPTRVDITKIRDTPRFHGVPVYLLSGEHGVKTGRLMSNFAHIGSGSGQKMCRAWVLILDGAYHLEKGECGTAVVDQETHEIYGQVVGTNPMNHAYVVPFKDIIEDIKYTFVTSDVSLLRTSEARHAYAKSEDSGCELQKRTSDGFRPGDLTRHTDCETPRPEDQGSDSASRRHSSSEFRSCIKNVLTKSFDTDTPQYFIPISDLRSLLSKDRIKAELWALSSSRPDISLVRERYLKVFAILLMIDHPSYIQKFVEEGISDQYLPFTRDCERWRALFPEVCRDSGYESHGETQYAKELASTTGCFRQSSSMWEDFYREQWRFCPPVLTKGQRVFDDNEILPIIEKTHLGEGQAAQTYKIRVHSDYDGVSFNHTALSEPHTFVLKTYREDCTDIFHKEVEEYEELRDSRGSTTVLKYYGSWQHRGSHHILLEHAPTLQDFFRETAPPDRTSDILTFWKGLLSLSQGLRAIHKTGDGDRKKEIHQDIRPSNIFHRHRCGGSKYELHLLRSLDSRDQVFLFDNSKSTESDWGEVSVVCEALAWIVKSQDFDGIDLSFTSCHSQKATRPNSTSTKLLSAIEGIENRLKAKGDNASLTILEVTRSFISGHIDHPDFHKRQEEILQIFEEKLKLRAKSGSDYTFKGTSDKRAVGSLLEEDFARNPVVDPYGAATTKSSRSRPFFSSNWNRSWRRSFLAFANTRSKLERNGKTEDQ